MAAVTLTVIM